MDHFKWQDYTKNDTALVDSWLDADAVRLTGLDEGFDEFCRYWENESDPARGEYFLCKIVSENTRPFAVIAYGYYSSTVMIMEVIIDSALRGQGRGTAVLREFINNAADWIKQPISLFEAVIFQNNNASKNIFYKAGFVRNNDEQERWRLAADNTEILFRYLGDHIISVPTLQVRRLKPGERRLFNTHLHLCGQKPMSQKRWNDAMKGDVRYYGLFADGKMVARSCVEKLTDRYWEISDVRVAQAYRNCGYATAICSFVASEILSAGRIPTIRTKKDNAAMLSVIRKLDFLPFADDLLDRYQCKIASLEEMHKKWDVEIGQHPDSKENWIIWKKEAIENAEKGYSLPYYGFLQDTIICEATAMICPDKVQNMRGLVDEHTAYLCAFRTVSAYQGLGYFSKLFHYMIDDLRRRGYTKVTLGVEPADEKNLKMYKHFGFNEFIKQGKETFPDGTVIDVLYYWKAI